MLEGQRAACLEPAGGVVSVSSTFHLVERALVWFVVFFLELEQVAGVGEVGRNVLVDEPGVPRG